MKTIKNRVKQGNRSAMGVQQRVKHVYDIDGVLAAMCVWEWLLEDVKVSPDMETLFGQYGTGAMRSTAIQVGQIAEEAWAYTEENETPVGHDLDAYDWEFVPAVCKVIDWRVVADDNQYQQGLYRPNPKEIVAAIIALKAMSKAA